MQNSACFIGHRKIEDTQKLRKEVRDVIMKLIDGGTVNFIFGGQSAFDTLCYDTVTELKIKHPQIRRIKFRTDYEDADEYTMRFLTSGYEESICPKNVARAGRAAYVQRNRAMLRESDVCVFYYDERYTPNARKSGTASAYNYALRKNMRIINCFYAERR